LQVRAGARPKPDGDRLVDRLKSAGRRAYFVSTRLQQGEAITASGVGLRRCFRAGGHVGQIHGCIIQNCAGGIRHRAGQFTGRCRLRSQERCGDDQTQEQHCWNTAPQHFSFAFQQAVSRAQTSQRVDVPRQIVHVYATYWKGNPDAITSDQRQRCIPNGLDGGNQMEDVLLLWNAVCLRNAGVRESVERSCGRAMRILSQKNKTPTTRCAIVGETLLEVTRV